MGGFPPVNTISDAEWAKIVDAAKKEGKLTCYCWDFNVTWKQDWVIKAFKEATGIDMEVMGFSGTISLERIKTEARAGKYIADIFDARMGYHFMGLEGTGLLKRVDNLPILKDAQNSDVFWANPITSPYVLEGPTVMSIPGITYMYNSNVMPAERLPKKWQDVLDPWYKQKLCEWDPITYAGIDYAVWGHFAEMGYPDWWADYTYDLYGKQNDMHTIKILGQPNPLYSGECGIAVYVGGAISGANVKVSHVIDKATWIKGGTFNPPTPIRFNRGDGYSILAKSPHPNAAMLFLNWFYSKEGGMSYSKLGFDRTRRRDVPHLLEKTFYPEKQVTTFWVPDGKWFDFEQYSYASKGTFKLMREGMSRDVWKKWMKDISTNYWGQYPPPAYPLYNFTEQELAP